MKFLFTIHEILIKHVLVKKRKNVAIFTYFKDIGEAVGEALLVLLLVKQVTYDYHLVIGPVYH